ncbi:MAG: anion permease [Clostridia bacterium]|nr:anion permease [Clostridia bacterium]
MKKYKRILDILAGAALFATIALILPDGFAAEAKIAMGMIAMMVYWWITRPVHYAVTALVPLVVNSVYPMIPMADLLGEYADPIVLLILGASILTAAWTLHGLDKRIALKSLTWIGTSVNKQLAVWFLLAVGMSAFLPNMVVAAALCPVAYAMMKYSGGSNDGKTSNLLLLAIVWGAGIGGIGTPMGGAMNLVVISNIEKQTGNEFLYWEWVARIFPFLLVLSAVVLAYILLIRKDTRELEGSKEYFKTQLQAAGPLSKPEAAVLLLFLFAVALSFTRPFYQGLFPGFTPPFAFLLMGLMTFLIKPRGHGRLMDWNYTAANINWGLLILFAGGLAAGGLITGTGAAESMAVMLNDNGSAGVIGAVMVIAAVGMFLANASSNTAACAVLVPMVITIAVGMGHDPLPYVFLTAAACNSAYALPTSIRAVPVGYGLDTGFMFRKGMIAILISYAALVLSGYAYILLLA